MILICLFAFVCFSMVIGIEMTISAIVCGACVVGAMYVLIYGSLIFCGSDPEAEERHLAEARAIQKRLEEERKAEFERKAARRKALAQIKTFIAERLKRESL